MNGIFSVIADVDADTHDDADAGDNLIKKKGQSPLCPSHPT